MAQCQPCCANCQPDRGRNSTKHSCYCALVDQVVKPIVETDISRAASSFAKDSTSIRYSWRNEKGTFKEKKIEVCSIFALTKQ